MKTIERQIRNHEFTIRFEPTSDGPDGPRCLDPIYIVDDVQIGHTDFAIALQLLSAEAPK